MTTTREQIAEIASREGVLGTLELLAGLCADFAGDKENIIEPLRTFYRGVGEAIYRVVTHEAPMF